MYGVVIANESGTRRLDLSTGGVKTGYLRGRQVIECPGEPSILSRDALYYNRY